MKRFVAIIDMKWFGDYEMTHKLSSRNIVGDALTPVSLCVQRMYTSLCVWSMMHQHSTPHC
jgi:hypothetical protein